MRESPLARAAARRYTLGGNTLKTRYLPIAAVATALLLTACTPIASSSSPSDEAPASAPSFAEPVESTAPEPEPEPESGILAFGEAMTWQDDVSLSVSAAAPFTPTEYAAGADQANNVVFTLVITNGSKEALEPSVYSRVSSGGVESSSIFDSGNPAGDIMGGPITTILPGQTIQWLEAYSIADPASITFQVSPGFEYEDAIFTNIG